MTSTTSTSSSTLGINTSGISVGSDGKITVSGFSSGIDWQSIISATITAKRAPAYTLESKITTNKAKITAYTDLQTKTKAVTDSLSALKGNLSSLDTDVFKSKTVTGTSAASATAVAGYTPSAADSLISAEVSQKAAKGTHTIVIDQLAQAQQVRSDSQTSQTGDLGISGTMTINGVDISVTSTDTLLDIRSKINTAGAGVTATIVSSSSSSYYLLLSSDTSGTANTMTFGTVDTTVSDALGLTASGVIKNQLQEAKNAILTVDGISGIERSTNDINDVIEGMTLSLAKAEPDTVVTLNVASDLNTIKTSITDFVTAYNALRTYITDQRTASDRNNDGTVASDEVGPLAYDSKLRQLSTQLSSLASMVMGGNADGYQSLSQLGITMNDTYKLEVDDTTLNSRLLTNVDAIQNLFAFNMTSSDSRVIAMNRTGDTLAGTYYLNIAGTDASGNVTSANIQTSTSSGAGGYDDASATVSASGITATSTTGAYGLSVLFNGGANASGVDGIQLTVSRGIADLFYDVFNDFTNTTSGQLTTAISDLTTQNTDYQTRVDDIDSKLETTKSNLEAKYAAVETALAKFATLQSTIKSMFNTNSNNSNG